MSIAVTKRLSIITINYNNAAGLEKTIGSVAEQTFTDFEYIVIDGGSTDGSTDTIRRYQDKITYWVSEPDKGIYNAMNKGILKATGEYLMFLNSGDWLAGPETIRTILGQPFTEDIIYGNMIKVFSDGTTQLDKGPQRSELTLYDMYFHTINHSSALIKKALFDRYSLYSEKYKIVSDWLFFLKTIGMEGVSVKYLDIDFNYFDKSGISSLQLDLRGQERKQGIAELVPPSIIRDCEELDRLKRRVKILEQIERRKMSSFAFKVFKKLFV